MGQDIVEWNIENSTSEPQACVLYRGVTGLAPAYYFGNAFYAVYLSSVEGQGSNATWYSSSSLLAPTPSNPNAAYPLAILETGSSEKLVCFIFIVPANSTLALYEGGIPDASKATDVHAYVVSISQLQQFCVTYSGSAVSDYEQQTGYTVSNTPTDPFTATTVLMTPIEANYPTNEIMPEQYAILGACK